MCLTLSGWVVTVCRWTIENLVPPLVTYIRCQCISLFFLPFWDYISLFLPLNNTTNDSITESVCGWHRPWKFTTKGRRSIDRGIIQDDYLQQSPSYLSSSFTFPEGTKWTTRTVSTGWLLRNFLYWEIIIKIKDSQKKWTGKSRSG